MRSKQQIISKTTLTQAQHHLVDIDINFSLHLHVCIYVGVKSQYIAKVGMLIFPCCYIRAGFLDTWMQA